MAKHKLTADERCNALSRLAGQLSYLGVTVELRRAEVGKPLIKKFQSFRHSLEGALRNAQAMRSREERTDRERIGKKVRSA